MNIPQSKANSRYPSRSKRLSSNVKEVDQETRTYVINTRIDQLENDFYDSPHRLAEDNSAEEFQIESFDENEKFKPQAKQKRIKRNNKRLKKESIYRKNFNLKKLIKEENLEEDQYPNFVSMRARPADQKFYTFCSICGNLSKYTCPRCGEKYCQLKCHHIHKEIYCLKFEL